MKKHHYEVQVNWTGNQGTGTSHYLDYNRDHELIIEGKPPISCSSDTAFRGDPNKHNPEELFLYAISSCHMLWYLHLCADAGVIVLSYTDLPTGLMIEEPEKGKFTEVILRPIIEVREESMIEKAQQMHTKAHLNCFISNSCNFPVMVIPEIRVKLI